MKKHFLLFVLMVLPLVAKAQNYGHDFDNCPGKVTCGACYGTGICYGYVCMSCGGTGLMNCAACAGYKAGQQMMKQMQEQRWNNAYNSFEDGIGKLLSKKYTDALKYLRRSAELGNGTAMAYLGNMYELGMGVEADTNTALDWYNSGKNRNDNLSSSNLNRIRQYGYWVASQTNRDTYIQNLNNMANMSAVMSQQIINGMNWGSSSNSRYSSSNSPSVSYIETIEYAPEYTGKAPDVWCEKCKKWMARHAHIKKPVR